MGKPALEACALICSIQRKARAPCHALAPRIVPAFKVLRQHVITRSSQHRHQKVRAPVEAAALLPFPWSSILF